MATASEYRELAAAQQRAAATTVLMIDRLNHLAAAQKWETCALEAERRERQHLQGH